MKQILVFVVIFLYFGVNFIEAQNGLNPQFTEWNTDEDLQATARGFDFAEEKNSDEAIDKEFKSDLNAIRTFAQDTKNMRRAMNSRRGMGQEVSILMNFVKNTIISLIDFTDQYIPQLKPLTIYLRRLIERIFGSSEIQ